MAGKENVYTFHDPSLYKSNQEMCGRSVTVVPHADFDTASRLVPEDMRKKMSSVVHQMLELGYSIRHLQDVSEVLSRRDAEAAAENMHDCAALLYTQWECARLTRDKVSELSLARVFNGVTQSARTLHTHFALFDTAHIEELRDALHVELQHNQQSDETDLQRIADAIHTAGNQRTHKNAWAWVVLPTFPYQHYGRILLSRVPSLDERYPIFITQPTFLDGEGTLFHTHGQNWAFARPLGNSSEKKNAHVNTIWQTHSAQSVFPLRQTDRTEYHSSNVVIIPPRVIHGISGGHKLDSHPHSFEELQDMSDRTSYARQSRFGENSSLHVYRPDQTLMQELEHSPLIHSNARFFMENDMIVFDHTSEKMWSGGGGAWPRRMMSYGPSGEHCGACFTENDPRQHHIDEQVILKWCTQREQKTPIVFTY